MNEIFQLFLRAAVVAQGRLPASAVAALDEEMLAALAALADDDLPARFELWRKNIAFVAAMAKPASASELEPPPKIQNPKSKIETETVIPGFDKPFTRALAVMSLLQNPIGNLETEIGRVSATGAIMEAKPDGGR